MHKNSPGNELQEENDKGKDDEGDGEKEKVVAGKEEEGKNEGLGNLKVNAVGHFKLGF